MQRTGTVLLVAEVAAWVAATGGAAWGATPTAVHSWEVTLRNSMNVARTASVIEIPGDRIALGAATTWSASIDGRPVPVQPFDRDEDGRPDALLISTDLAPHAVQRIRLEVGQAATTAMPSTVQAMIGVRRGAALRDGKWVGGRIDDVERLDLDASHVAGDRLTLYDGPAWESGQVAFRIYLDQRNALDLFGKKQPAPVLQWIGRGIGDYHKEADWGMDILHVTDSLGAGGLGVIEQGHVRQIGAARGGVRGWRIANGPVVAGVAVDDRGLLVGGVSYDLHARYTIAAGTRVTQVDARATAGAPIVAGIEKRPGVAVLRSGGRGRWAYVATYGQQSFIGDGLGMAMFYRRADAAEVGDDGHTVFIRFRDPAKIHYAVTAAWAKEQGGLVDQAGFVAFLDQSLRALAHPPVVAVTVSK